MTTGMELSKKYFQNYAPAIISEFKQYEKYMAFGLVGEGSECFGFDDQTSQDHDFGAGFCIWLPENIYQEVGGKIQAAYDKLPEVFMGYKRGITAQGAGRTGVLSIERFYQKYTGLTTAPKDNVEWFKIKESFLATATNGEVFLDNYGEFSSIRASLKAFYPREVQMQKLGARVALMAQSGQYNYPRMASRGDMGACYLAEAEFVENTLAAMALISEIYLPFYKWSFKTLENNYLWNETLADLKTIIAFGGNLQNAKQKTAIIEKICQNMIKVLNSKGYARSTSDFLMVQAEEIHSGITDVRLKNLPLMLHSI